MSIDNQTMDKISGELLEVRASYLSNGKRFLNDWNPTLEREADAVKWSGAEIQAKTVDAQRNSGLITGAINAATNFMVGTGLKLQAKPHIKLFDGDLKKRDKFAKHVESEFALYASEPDECDAARTSTLGEHARTACKQWMLTGEVLGTLENIKLQGVETRTKVNLLDPLCLSRFETYGNSKEGIISNKYGAPQAYVFKMVDERTSREFHKIVPTYTRTGRPLVIQVFDRGVGKRRGISPLAPVLHTIRKYDTLSEATLINALIRNMFAIEMKSDMSPDVIFRALQTKNEKLKNSELGKYLGEATKWYKDHSIDFNEHGRVVHTFPGESMHFHNANVSSDNYSDFVKWLLREIASCLGVSFETFTGDYNGATYSSVRIATSENWSTIEANRKMIPARFYQMVYNAWLEEQILNKSIPFPGGWKNFVRNRTAACRSIWSGPQRPTADDEKQVKAAILRIQNGLSTWENECALLGLDWMDVMDQQGVEIGKAKECGLEHLTRFGAKNNDRKPN